MSIKTLVTSTAAVLALLGTPSIALAHCDALDGPVVKAAGRALAMRDVSYALVWVQPDGEAEVRAAFADAIAVRALSADARKLADRYFFETVVRVHRAGEGASFDGLKPAGRDIGPAIPAADAALAGGSLKTLAEMLTAELSSGLHRRFEEVAEARLYDPHDLGAGRKFVKAYVEYIHYVERLHEALASASQRHFAGTPPR